MIDANDAPQVSLETDHLEQLLEVPEAGPAPPVVMIEYRNRGVPWWVLASLVVLIPVAAVLIYRRWVDDAYRAGAAEAAYLKQMIAIQSAVPPPAPVDSSATQPPEAIAAAAQPPVGVGAAGAASGAASAKGSSWPTSVAAENSAQAPKASDSVIKVAADVQPPEGRVRTIAPGPLESVDATPAPSEKGPSVRSTKADTPPTTKLASAETGARKPGDAASGEAAKADPAGKAAAARGPAGGAGPGDVRDALAPLPSREEWQTELAKESARKNAELAADRAALKERESTRRAEDPVRFHEELKRILGTDPQNAGTEIDALVKRDKGDHDTKTYNTARSIWRYGRISMAAKVSQIRAMNIPESDILNFMSDNLHAQMHTRGGPRDSNDVRVRAARLLLSYDPMRSVDTAAPRTDPSGVIKRRVGGTTIPR